MPSTPLAVRPVKLSGTLGCSDACEPSAQGLRPGRTQASVPAGSGQAPPTRPVQSGSAWARHTSRTPICCWSFLSEETIELCLCCGVFKIRPMSAKLGKGDEIVWAAHGFVTASATALLPAGREGSVTMRTEQGPWCPTGSCFLAPGLRACTFHAGLVSRRVSPQQWHSRAVPANMMPAVSD